MTASADPESFARGGPTQTSFFSVCFFPNEGKEDQIPLTVSHHLPTSETPFKFAGGPMMAQN